MAESTTRPVALVVLIVLLSSQGMSALVPGLMMLLEPTGGLLGTDVSLLQGSPFRDFTVPGLLLAGVLGMGAWFVAASLLFQPAWHSLERINPIPHQRWPWLAAVTYGVGLMVWIGVQVAMIGFGSSLQPIFFAVGALIVAITFVPSVRAATARTTAAS